MDLELPDGYVDRESQRPASLLEILNSELAQRYALPRAYFAIDAGECSCVSVVSCSKTEKSILTL